MHEVFHCLLWFSLKMTFSGSLMVLNLGGSCVLAVQELGKDFLHFTEESWTCIRRHLVSFNST